MPKIKDLLSEADKSTLDIISIRLKKKEIFGTVNPHNDVAYLAPVPPPETKTRRYEEETNAHSAQELLEVMRVLSPIVNPAYFI